MADPIKKNDSNRMDELFNGLFGNNISSEHQQVDDKGITVELDVPGSSKKDVSAELKDGIITIKADLRSFGKVVDTYSKQFKLDERYDQNSITVNVEFGVIVIRIKLLPKAQPTKIVVH